jgi:D-alanine-D-alanine ligase
MSALPRKIAVLMGGPSAEREVSLRSGAAAAEALRTAGFEVTEVTVDDENFAVPAGTELAFLAMHGPFGEDGQVQRILQARGIPYTGADEQVSSICIDKEKTKDCFRASGVLTPRGQLVSREDEIALPLPIFIKPNTLGSSVGSAPVFTKEEIAPALASALQYGAPALVEQYVRGRELTVSLLDGKALPIIEIRPLQGFYDYKNKYTKGFTEYLCPAPLPDEITRLIQEQAVKAYYSVGNPIYCRIDFLLEKDTYPYCLEINTIPGMTATSLLPKAAAAVGVSFPELCRRIVELSWAARGEEGVA